MVDALFSIFIGSVLVSATVVVVSFAVLTFKMVKMLKMLMFSKEDM